MFACVLHTRRVNSTTCKTPWQALKASKSRGEDGAAREGDNHTRAVGSGDVDCYYKTARTYHTLFTTIEKRDAVSTAVRTVHHVHDTCHMKSAALPAIGSESAAMVHQVAPVASHLV